MTKTNYKRGKTAKRGIREWMPGCDSSRQKRSRIPNAADRRIVSDERSHAGLAERIRLVSCDACRSRGRREQPIAIFETARGDE